MKKTVWLILALTLAIPSYRAWAEDTTTTTPATTETTTQTQPAKNTVAATPAETPTVAAPAPVTTAASVTEPTAPSEPAMAATAPTPAPAPAAAPVATAPATASPEATAPDNLEFISGEISSVDEAAKTISVKLYGENENAAAEKILSVKLDEHTDITDGEKDRDLKSLTPGTEVDVEYDPASSKATYIFVY